MQHVAWNRVLGTQVLILFPFCCSSEESHLFCEHWLSVPFISLPLVHQQKTQVHTCKVPHLGPSRGLSSVTQQATESPKT